MNRQIIFRAKNDNGIWIYGCYTHPIDKYHKYPHSILITETPNGEEEPRIPHKVVEMPINPDTLGQYTGVDDKDGKRIFEGDILKIDDVYCEVGWNPMQSAFCIRFSFETRLGLRTLGSWLAEKRNTVVVGNIHDSPELLDEKTSKIIWWFEK